MKKLKFLVCVNDKEYSLTALKYACFKAKNLSAKVLMMCVIDPVDYNTVFSIADMIKEDRINEMQKAMKEMAKEAEEKTSVKPESIIVEGDIHDEVINKINSDQSISILILGVAPDGSSSKSGLFSSLSASMGEKFHVPIIAVPGNLSDDDIKRINHDI